MRSNHQTDTRSSNSTGPSDFEQLATKTSNPALATALRRATKEQQEGRKDLVIAAFNS